MKGIGVIIFAAFFLYVLGQRTESESDRAQSQVGYSLTYTADSSLSSMEIERNLMIQRIKRRIAECENQLTQDQTGTNQRKDQLIKDREQLNKERESLIRQLSDLSLKTEKDWKEIQNGQTILP